MLCGRSGWREPVPGERGATDRRRRSEPRSAPSLAASIRSAIGHRRDQTPGRSARSSPDRRRRARRSDDPVRWPRRRASGQTARPPMPSPRGWRSRPRPRWPEHRSGGQTPSNPRASAVATIPGTKGTVRGSLGASRHEATGRHGTEVDARTRHRVEDRLPDLPSPPRQPARVHRFCSIGGLKQPISTLCDVLGPRSWRPSPSLSSAATRPSTQQASESAIRRSDWPTGRPCQDPCRSRSSTQWPPRAGTT